MDSGNGSEAGNGLGVGRHAIWIVQKGIFDLVHLQCVHGRLGVGVKSCANAKVRQWGAGGRGVTQEDGEWKRKLKTDFIIMNGILTFLFLIFNNFLIDFVYMTSHMTYMLVK